MLVDKYKLIVFDLDGTLVHTTAEYRYYIVPKVLYELGIKKKISQKIIDKFWFDGQRNITIEKYFSCNPLIFWKVFNKLDQAEERAKYTHVYDDVWEALKELKERGKLLAITTGAPKRLVQIELALLPKAMFEKITSITSTRYKEKPHPGSLLGILKFCKAKPIDSVYIGNSNEDAQYAKNAGIDFIYLERREHDFSGKQIIAVQSFRELIDE